MEAAVTTAEVTKDIVEKMIGVQNRPVEQEKFWNQELKHNAKEREHVSVKVSKNTIMRLSALMKCQQKILNC